MLDSMSFCGFIINTPLQRGGWQTKNATNRFSGFRSRWETVETVPLPSHSQVTPLKRGVNEIVGECSRFHRI